MTIQERTKRDSRIYIVGAGFTGRAIAREIASKAILGTVVAFLDDDQEKIGRRIEDVPVLGPIKDVVFILERTPADEAIIAIPSASREWLRDLYNTLKRSGFRKIRIIPSVSQILEGNAHLIQARDIDPADLLGRNPVTIGLKKSLSYIKGKRVLVSGAGGSIGSELARQLLEGGAERLYLFGHGENSIYQVDKELRLLQEEGVGQKATIIPIVGELKDRPYMGFLMKRLKADIVFHCAAYKHVPMMEANTVAAIENNVFGTKNLVDACIDSGVKRFVLISTDKAVSPSSVYGASKLLSERIVMAARENAKDGQDLMVVRFGNVLGSRGSIIPLWRSQIEKGGPVTVTDPEATRYFMTIPEACSLVLKTGGVGKSGTTYLLDMGEPVRIKDLAEQLIRFYGYEPGKEIAIENIGLRAGERLHESLTADDELATPTEFKRINKLESKHGHSFELEPLLSDLEPICRLDPDKPGAYRNRALLRAALRLRIPSILEAPNETEY